VEKGGVRLNFSGQANGRFRIEASRDLIQWIMVGTTTVGPDGVSQFSHTPDPARARFYRVVTP
jgi:hypothetical protein